MLIEMKWLKEHVPEWAYRAIRTFIQAFIFTLATNYSLYFSGVNFGDKSAVKAALISLVESCLTAALSAVCNLPAKTGDNDDGTEGKDNE